MNFQTAQFHTKLKNSHHTQQLRIGYVRLVDAAPFIIAKELGFFKKHNLNVSLERQIGWATVRDKIAFNELDMAQALGPMIYALNLGLGCAPTECISSLILNRNGNAITLSNELWHNNVRDAETFATYLKAIRGIKKTVIGVVSRHSAQYFLLQKWLESANIDSEKDVQIQIVPPDLMFRNLEGGNLDGFVVGEPWNSYAVSKKVAWIPVTSSELMPAYPEKILLTTKRFSEEKHENHLNAIRALYEAAEYCDNPHNTETITELLARDEYLSCPKSIIKNSLGNNFQKGNGIHSKDTNILRFHRYDTNRPDPSSAQVLLNDMNKYCKLDLTQKQLQEMPFKLFKEQIFEEAIKTLN